MSLTTPSPLSLHDALPISTKDGARFNVNRNERVHSRRRRVNAIAVWRKIQCVGKRPHRDSRGQDRKSTRLNSSHTVISYAVFCLKKKNICVTMYKTETFFT